MQQFCLIDVIYKEKAGNARQAASNELKAV